METVMPRCRLNPDGPPLTSTERVRRHRLRKRGVEVPPAPVAPTPVDEIEAMFGCRIPTWEDVIAAVAAVHDDKAA
jgi:hypothetical protein